MALSLVKGGGLFASSQEEGVVIRGFLNLAAVWGLVAFAQLLYSSIFSIVQPIED